LGDWTVVCVGGKKNPELRGAPADSSCHNPKTRRKEKKKTSHVKYTCKNNRSSLPSRCSLQPASQLASMHCTKLGRPDVLWVKMSRRDLAPALARVWLMDFEADLGLLHSLTGDRPFPKIQANRVRTNPPKTDDSSGFAHYQSSGTFNTTCSQPPFD
jgi:hypothetical protein